MSWSCWTKPTRPRQPDRADRQARRKRCETPPTESYCVKRQSSGRRSCVGNGIGTCRSPVWSRRIAWFFLPVPDGPHHCGKLRPQHSDSRYTDPVTSRPLNNEVRQGWLAGRRCEGWVEGECRAAGVGVSRGGWSRPEPCGGGEVGSAGREGRFAGTGSGPEPGGRCRGGVGVGGTTGRREGEAQSGPGAGPAGGGAMPAARQAALKTSWGVR